MLHFLNHSRRDRPAARDLVQKFRYFVHRIGAPMRQEQNRISSISRQVHSSDQISWCPGWVMWSRRLAREAPTFGTVPNHHSELFRYSCTNLASALTFSTGVSGKMPCPKLKI